MKKIMFNDHYGLTAAVLTGKKTQTRRCEFDEAEQQELSDADAIGYGQGCCQVWKNGRIERQIPSRYKVGEVLAVAQSYKDAGYKKGYYRDEDTLIPLFRGDDKDNDIAASPAGWENKMFVSSLLMPHHIRITDIRVERLQDISDEDCIKEGIFHNPDSPFSPYGLRCDTGMICLGDTPREAFATLIDKVSGKGTWERNPYVFVYEFELI